MQRRLTRSRSDRRLFGVCGGMAEYFNVDPTVARLVAIILVLFDGIGVFIYLVLAVLLPTSETRGQQSARADLDEVIKDIEHTVEEVAARVEEKVENLARESAKPSHARHSPWVGIALIVGGLWLLARNLGLMERLNWNISLAFRPHLGFIVPVGLVVLGLVLVLSERSKRRE